RGPDDQGRGPPGHSHEGDSGRDGEKGHSDCEEGGPDSRQSRASYRQEVLEDDAGDEEGGHGQTSDEGARGTGQGSADGCGTTAFTDASGGQGHPIDVAAEGSSAGRPRP